MEIRAGFYRHFKGGLYFVLGVVNDSETVFKNVIYVDVKNALTYSRPVNKWNELVIWPDGVMRSRFVKTSALNAIRGGRLQRNPKA